MANDRYYKPHNPNREKLGFSDGNEEPIYEEYIESDWSKEEVNELKATRDHFFEMNFWEMNSPFGIGKLSFDFLEEPQLEEDWKQLLQAWRSFSHSIDCMQSIDPKLEAEHNKSFDYLKLVKKNELN